MLRDRIRRVVWGKMVHQLVPLVNGTMGSFAVFLCLFFVQFATGIGAWYGGPRTNSDAQGLLITALNRGQNLWDTSDCYGQAENALGS